MPGAWFKGPNGEVVHLYGSRIIACSCCQWLSKYQCDWRVGTGTCDAHLCETHAHQVGENKHLCPRHQQVWDRHPRNPKNGGAPL